MTDRTQTFDGQTYLDGAASDPRLLGLMQGAPPPAERRVRFDDDRFFSFPFIRWSLSHMRELLPTANVARSLEPASDLGGGSDAAAGAIEALRIHDLQGREHSWLGALEDTYCDGILVLHRGVRIYERYFGALTPERPHSCFSVTKSYAATLAAALIHERVLDEAQRVSFYLPETAATGFADATLRQVLDMQTAIAYSEVYSDPGNDFWNYARAGELRARPPGYDGPRTYYDFLLTLRKHGEHGATFAYKTVNTELLCWIMKRVTGLGLADLLTQRIWSRIGCERDAYLAVDSIGVEMGGAGLHACLRDLARFGELMRCDGARGGVQVLPAAVVAAIRAGSDRTKFVAGGYPLLRGYSYRDMWWITHNALGAFEARGIHGQRLYVAPGAELVVARFASHPIAANSANDVITLPALEALAALVLRG